MIEANAMKTYRIVQILTQLVNDVWRKPAMTVLIWGTILNEVVSLYFLITSANDEPFIIIAIFLIPAIDYFIKLPLYKIY